MYTCLSSYLFNSLLMRNWIINLAETCS